MLRRLTLCCERERCCAQGLPSGDLEALLQQHPEMMGRAPSFGMGKLESMELPDAVAAVVRHPSTLAQLLCHAYKIVCTSG